MYAVSPANVNDVVKKRAEPASVDGGATDLGERTTATIASVAALIAIVVPIVVVTILTAAVAFIVVVIIIVIIVIIITVVLWIVPLVVSGDGGVVIIRCAGDQCKGATVTVRTTRRCSGGLVGDFENVGSDLVGIAGGDLL